MSKTDFLTNSISDNQATIRAIDAKFFGTIALFIIPLSEYSTIQSALRHLTQTYPRLSICLLVILLASWLTGILISFLGIMSVHNPAEKIKDVDKTSVTGVFYNASLFGFRIWNVLWTKGIKSKSTLQEIIEKSNLSDDELDRELAFEQAKIAFIRDLKIARQKLSIYCLIIYTVCIVLVLVLHGLIQSCGTGN